MLFNKLKEKCKMKKIDLECQCQMMKLDLDNREYLINEQYQRIDRKQAFLLKILDECNSNSYKSINEFRAKIKELAETGIKY